MAVVMALAAMAAAVTVAVVVMAAAERVVATMAAVVVRVVVTEAAATAVMAAEAATAAAATVAAVVAGYRGSSRCTSSRQYAGQCTYAPLPSDRTVECRNLETCTEYCTLRCRVATGRLSGPRRAV